MAYPTLAGALAGPLAPNQASNVNLVRPARLDGMLTRPRAVWATTVVVGDFGGAAYPVGIATINDQSGAGRNLAKVTNAVTTTPDAAGVDAFAFAANTAYSRADVLGLSGDPAVTVGWRMKLTGDPAALPELLDIGNDATHQNIRVYFERDAGNDYVHASNSDASGKVTWALAHGALDSEHYFVMVKSAGSGFGSSGWRLFADGVDLGGPGSSLTQSLVMTTGTTVFGDFGAGGFPLVGNVPVLAVWATALAGNDVAALNDFLSYR